MLIAASEDAGFGPITRHVRILWRTQNEQHTDLQAYDVFSEQVLALRSNVPRCSTSQGRGVHPRTARGKPTNEGAQHHGAVPPWIIALAAEAGHFRRPASPKHGYARCWRGGPCWGQSSPRCQPGPCGTATWPTATAAASDPPPPAPAAGAPPAVKQPPPTQYGSQCTTPVLSRWSAS